MDAKTTQKVDQFVKSKNMIKIYANLVTKHHKRGGKAPRIMIFCENFLYVLTKGVKEKHNYPWYLLTEIQVEADTVLLLFSNDTQFKFESPEAKRAEELIVYHIHRILSEEEFKAIKIPNVPSSLPPHSGVSMVWRLSYFIHTLIPNSSLNDYNYIIKDVITSSKTLDLSDLPPSQEAYQAVLTALKFEYTFKTITFRKIKEFDVFDIIAKYYDFKIADKLCFIGIHTGEGFKNFLAALKKAKKCNLVVLSFTGIGFTNDEVDVIMHVARVKSLTSLIFDHCLTKDTFDHFQENSDLPSLRYLSLENNAFFNVSFILPKLKNLYALSLCNCGKSLGDIFEAISQADLPNLRGLNVSMNFGTQINGKKIQFPPKLSNLSADNIKWKIDDLISFFGTVTNHASSSSLKRFVCSFSNAKLEQNDWPRFNKFIQNREATNLQNFRWDENPVSPELFMFLKNSGNVRYISMNGCIDDSNYQDLVDFVKSNEEIENILIRGNKNKQITDVLPLCNSLQTAPNFLFLDYTYNKVEDRQLNTLLTAVSRCPKLEGIAIDNTNVTSCEKYINAIQPLKDLGRPISFSIPFNDISRMNGDPKITELRQLIHDLGCPPRKSEWPDDPIVSSYYFVANDFFPPYLSRSAVEMIRREDENESSSDNEHSDDERKSTLLVDEVSLPSIVVSREISLVNDKPRKSGGRVKSRGLRNGSLQEFPLNTNESSEKEPPKYEKPRSPKRQQQLVINKPKVSWDFPLRYVPDIDNAELLQQTDQQYSFVQIVKDLH